jgi:lysozyme
VSKKEKELLLLLGLGSIALWLWFTRSGQSAASAAGSIFSTEPQLGPPAGVGPQDSTYRLIANFEGFSATPYRDAGGWSIGYGHYMGASPTQDSITQEDAWTLLMQDAAKAANAVGAAVQVPLTQNQFDSLVSLAYNIGNNAFLASTLLYKLNNGDYQGASAEFDRWHYSQGQTSPALVARRDQEKQLFLT